MPWNTYKNGQVQSGAAENSLGNGLMSSSGRFPEKHDVKSLELKDG